MSDNLLVEIDDLVNYISKNAVVNCKFGNTNPEPGSYPIVMVIPDQEFSFYWQTETISFQTFPVTCKIVANREDERDALEVLLRLFRCLNNFKAYKGHIIGETGEPEYTDNTYEIKVSYELKISTE